MKLEEIIPLLEEKHQLKELDYKSMQGFEFVKKELANLKEAQKDGWNKKTYRKLAKQSKSNQNLSEAVGFNPLDIVNKKGKVKK